MGELIRIEEETGTLKFRIRFTATGNEMEVTVDHDKQVLFRTRDLKTLQPEACPFLRSDKNKKALCTIHHTRPDLCRIYICFRLLVLSPDGDYKGRVQDGSRFFSTMNLDLRRLWQDGIAGAIIPDEAVWETSVAEVFERAGYRIVR